MGFGDVQRGGSWGLRIIGFLSIYCIAYMVACEVDRRSTGLNADQ